MTRRDETRRDETRKARPHDAISCTQSFSNSLIRKLSLWFQHNSRKESYDTNRIVCTGLKTITKTRLGMKVSNLLVLEC